LVLPSAPGGRERNRLGIGRRRAVFLHRDGDGLGCLDGDLVADREVAQVDGLVGLERRRLAVRGGERDLARGGIHRGEGRDVGEGVDDGATLAGRLDDLLLLDGVSAGAAGEVQEGRRDDRQGRE
jgi:hypothetical protein